MNNSPPSTPPTGASFSPISSGLARLQIHDDYTYGLEIHPAREAVDSPESAIIAEQNVNEEGNNEDAMDVDHPIEPRRREENDIGRRVRARNGNDEDDQEGENEQENNNIVFEEVEMTDDEASGYNLLKGNNNAFQNKPRTGGMWMFFGDRRIPFQLICNHPNGVGPLGTMKRPIYKGNVKVVTVATCVDVNHFSIDVENGRQRIPYPVTLWNRVNNVNNENIVFGEGRIGFEICNLDGMVELIGKTNIELVTKVDIKNVKQKSRQNELTPRGDWPSSNNISQWDYPITVNHREGKFHGNEGGQQAAYTINSTAPAAIARRKQTSTIMNHFYLLNHELVPPNRMGIDGDEFTRLRNNQGDYDENEEMWQRIVSGTI